MNSGKIIFSQTMDFLPTYEFRQCVERYHGNYKMRLAWQQQSLTLGANRTEIFLDMNFRSFYNRRK